MQEMSRCRCFKKLATGATRTTLCDRVYVPDFFTGTSLWVKTLPVSASIQNVVGYMKNGRPLFYLTFYRTEAQDSFAANLKNRAIHYWFVGAHELLAYPRARFECLVNLQYLLHDCIIYPTDFFVSEFVFVWYALSGEITPCFRVDAGRKPARVTAQVRGDVKHNWNEWKDALLQFPGGSIRHVFRIKRNVAPHHSVLVSGRWIASA